MWFSRKDGTLARDLPPYRRIMPFIMRGKNESIAYFEQTLDLTKTEAFIQEWNRRGGLKITLYHVFLWGVVQVLGKRPRLNRFIAGSHIYQRDGIWISTSAKKAMNDDSPVVVLKRRYEPERRDRAVTAGEVASAIESWLRQYRTSVPDKYRDRPITLVVHPLLATFLRRGIPSRLFRWRLSMRGLPYAVAEDAALDPLAFVVRDDKSGKMITSKYTPG